MLQWHEVYRTEGTQAGVRSFMAKQEYHLGGLWHDFGFGLDVADTCVLSLIHSACVS